MVERTCEQESWSVDHMIDSPSFSVEKEDRHEQYWRFLCGLVVAHISNPPASQVFLAAGRLPTNACKVTRRQAFVFTFVSTHFLVRTWHSFQACHQSAGTFQWSSRTVLWLHHFGEWLELLLLTGCRQKLLVSSWITPGREESCYEETGASFSQANHYCAQAFQIFEVGRGISSSIKGHIIHITNIYVLCKLLTRTRAWWWHELILVQDLIQQ